MKMPDIYTLEMADPPDLVLTGMDELKLEVRDIEQDRKRKRTWASVLFIVGVVAGSVAFFGFGSKALDTTTSTLACLAAAGLLGAAFVLITRFASRSFPWTRYQAAHRVLYDLRDDARQVVGRLDLTDPRQSAHIVRTSYSYGSVSGKRKRKDYFRRPWFQIKVKLLDGNAVTFSAVDRVKTKAGQTMEHHIQFTLKLVIDPDVYRVSGEPLGELPVPAELVSEENGVLTVAHESQSEDPTRWMSGIAETVKVLYSHLEPTGRDRPAIAET